MNQAPTNLEPMMNDSILPTMPKALDVLADTVSFRSDEPLALAGRVYMAKQACKLYKRLPGALAGDDPYHIHQARVATRRLRASLQATASAYRQTSVKQLRKQLRKLARALGAVRDRDVLLLRIRNDVAQLPEAERAPLHAAIERVQHERDQVHSKLVAELHHKRTATLLQNLNDFLLSPLEDVQADDNSLPLLVRHYAGSTIWQRYEAVRHFETAVPHASATQLHMLRIACKHLRYTLELFEPALPQEAQDMIKRVTAMQEHLGNLHDTDVAIAYLSSHYALNEPEDSQEVAEHNPDGESIHLPLAYYLTQLQEERAGLLAGVEGIWDGLILLTTRRKLAWLIAEL
jgi:CHAD domain-containing protein